MRRFDPEKIKKRRMRLGMTQLQLARAVGTAREYIAEIERGRSVPSATFIAKFADALSVKESYFFA